jgi:hypothetical protein
MTLLARLRPVPACHNLILHSVVREAVEGAPTTRWLHLIGPWTVALRWHIGIQLSRALSSPAKTHNETTRIPCVPAPSHAAPSPPEGKVRVGDFSFPLLPSFDWSSFALLRVLRFAPRILTLRFLRNWRGAPRSGFCCCWVVLYGFDLRDLRLRARAAVESARYGVHCGYWPQDFVGFVLFMFGIYA